MEKKVLLIDDEASLRRSVSMGLMQKGYETEPCESGMKALQTLNMFKRKKLPLACAIVDIRLPDIDGLKLLKVIKFSYPSLPVIIITGYGSETIAEEAKTADAYLEKPFSMEDLAKVLEEVEPTPKEQPALEPPVAVAPAGERPVSAYAMVAMDKPGNLMDAFRKLYFHGNVLYCDAIRGEYDLVLLLQGKTIEEINEVVEEEIKTLKGVSDVTLLDVETPIFGENVIDIMGNVDKALGRNEGEPELTGTAARTRVCSYVMVEVEKEKMEAVYPALYFNDQVVNCDYTAGAFNMVLLMKGTSFADIESTIKHKVKSLDGVLKIREYPVITLFEA